MTLLRLDTDTANFFETLSGPGDRLLMLDYDGTLAPFTADRKNAEPYEGVVPMLERLIAPTRNKVVLVSGRSVRDLTSLLPIAERIETWGSHGFERRCANGEYSAFELSETTTEVLHAFEFWLASRGFPGRYETKPASIALHWRDLPASESISIKESIEKEWSSNRTPGLEFQEFNMGIELRANGFNKGRVVRSLLSEHPRNIVAAYFGDDATDEDAFRALRGHGLRVLVGDQVRETEADVYVTAPIELLELLSRWLSAE